MDPVFLKMLLYTKEYKELILEDASDETFLFSVAL